jgi:hypothetical protein
LNYLTQEWEARVHEMVAENIEEEKQLAIADGAIDDEGIPRIMAIGDGGWGTRSYNHTMRSNTGWVSETRFLYHYWL